MKPKTRAEIVLSSNERVKEGYKKMNKYRWHYSFPVGELSISETDQKITEISFRKKESEFDGELKETPLIRQAAEELKEYFDGTRKEFQIPWDLYGTSFQKRVWNALYEIPYGETRSYEDIAVRVGNPKACRAVGMANNKNPLMIVVPCHRVVGKNGSLTGYGGGISVKEYLLRLEKES